MAKRDWSSLDLISLSRSLERAEYTLWVRGWVFGGSLVIFLIIVQALLYEIGWAGPGIFAALLAAASAASLPAIPQWPGIHCMVILALIELMRFRMVSREE